MTARACLPQDLLGPLIRDGLRRYGVHPLGAGHLFAHLLGRFQRRQREILALYRRTESCNDARPAAQPPACAQTLYAPASNRGK